MTQYNDVIQWLERKSITEPEKTERVIKININIVATAFSKPREYITNLLHRESFEGISEEDKKILNFYFRLFRKWMD